MNLAPYSKTVASFIGGALTWAAIAYVPDGTVDRNEWYALALKLAVDVGVFGVTNGPAKAKRVPVVADTAVPDVPVVVA